MRAPPIFEWSVFPCDKRAGVYALMAGRNVQYIGKSTDVYLRIVCHRATNKIPFDSVRVLNIGRKGLFMAEKQLITKYAPPFNVAYARRQRSPDMVVVRFRVAGQMKARFMRISLVKQSNSAGAAACLLEAIVEKVSKEERALKLPPITKKQIRELLAKEDQ